MSALPQHLERQVAGAAAEIQPKSWDPTRTRPHQGDSFTTPGFVDVQREQMVQQIIARSYGGKHLANLPGFRTQHADRPEERLGRRTEGHL